MHTVIDFRNQVEQPQREDPLEFTVDEDLAAVIRVNTRGWRQRNGLEPEQPEAA